MASPTTPGSHSAGTAVPHDAHGNGGFPPFQGDTFMSQILWLVIAFGLLYWLLSKVTLPRIGGILEERGARIARDLAEAQRLKTESEAAGAAYEKSLADARGNAQAIAADTHAKISAEAEAIRKSLEADLAAKLQKAEAQIAASKTKAMASVRGIAVETVPAIVEHLVGTTPAAAEVEKAVDAALKS
jgi:F-type H+-transporting ATPase subunit b